jgi:hypothetical protein
VGPARYAGGLRDGEDATAAADGQAPLADCALVFYAHALCGSKWAAPVRSPAYTSRQITCIQILLIPLCVKPAPMQYNLIAGYYRRCEVCCPMHGTDQAAMSQHQHTLCTHSGRSSASMLTACGTRGLQSTSTLQSLQQGGCARRHACRGRPRSRTCVALDAHAACSDASRRDLLSAAAAAVALTVSPGETRVLGMSQIGNIRCCHLLLCRALLKCSSREPHAGASLAAQSIYDFAPLQYGEPVVLSKFKGRALFIVNIASA